MTHIRPHKFDKDAILVNGKTLVLKFYKDFKERFTTAEQKAIENYKKSLNENTPK